MAVSSICQEKCFLISFLFAFMEVEFVVLDIPQAYFFKRIV